MIIANIVRCIYYIQKMKHW